MPIDLRLLILTQWLSPAYPLGAFAFSHGLEAACADGQVHDSRGLEAWLRSVLETGSGWGDAVWIAVAARGERPLTEVEALAEAFAASSERLRETRQQGAAFARITSDIWTVELQACVLPVALGEAARVLSLDVEAVIALYLQGLVTNLVAAGQRLMPLGQTAAQAIVAGLSPLCAEIAARAVLCDETDVYSNAYASDIAAMRHEIMESRVFQS
ncbi:urease accessory protein UreF [Sagittula salina]|uniref:Urease accessory protein UreF n=1 Tax=Sagittula salina TaxID=2820268 RepID=A0A940RZZ3_9RHOB|nr:urease accessory UreF family protein [Sagittula salina]MBP0482493.1 urease accessory protein UreF [Sagittula salina]